MPGAGNRPRAVGGAIIFPCLAERSTSLRRIPTTFPWWIPGLITGATFSPADAGEVVVLYANGFGLTNPAAPNGELLTTSLPLVTTPTVTIGGVQAQVVFAGMSAPGLFQLNVIVPSGLPAGDAVVVAQPTARCHG